jgi:hypothetical protein
MAARCAVSLGAFSPMLSYKTYIGCVVFVALVLSGLVEGTFVIRSEASVEICKVVPQEDLVGLISDRVLVVKHCLRANMGLSNVYDPHQLENFLSPRFLYASSLTLKVSNLLLFLHHHCIFAFSVKEIPSLRA